MGLSPELTEVVTKEGAGEDKMCGGVELTVVVEPVDFSWGMRPLTAWPVWA